MSPKASSEIIEAIVERERQWAYSLWMARQTYSQIRRLANLPESEGGLGHDLSEGAVKNLVRQARDARGDLTMSRAERVERQSAEVDVRAAGARRDYDAARSYLNEPRPRRKDFGIIDDYYAALAGWGKSMSLAVGMIESADRRLDAAHKREAALHGLDEPTTAKLEVTSRDAVDEELNAMLERLDKKPRKAERSA